MVKTKYEIGDLIYLATAEDLDREVIKAIKIVGLKKTVSYGFKERGNYLTRLIMGAGDGFRWVKESNVFESLAAAEKQQDKLKAKAAAKAEQERLEEIAEAEMRLQRDTENLRRKKEGLPLLDEDDDF